MTYDVVIVGGSFAGLASAIYLARAHKRVCVLDTSLPRNRFATASHGFFAQDGSQPSDLLATMRLQVAAYPTVEFINEAALSITGAGALEAFNVALSGGSVVAGRRILLAHGITDILPDIAGLPQRWGKTVLHCPYCHGFEVSGQRLGVLNLSPMSLQQSLLVCDWGPTVFFANGEALDETYMAKLERRGVEVERGPVASLEGIGEILASVRLADGKARPLDALFINPPYRLSCNLASQLGCQLQDLPLGQAVATSETRETTVPGVFAAGDITRAMHNITFACADGVMAAMSMHRSLL